MGNISWTKSWSASDDGTVFGGADIENIQDDITGVVNGSITNANVNAAAAIAESKIAFDTSAGHDHDGTDSKLIASKNKNYRKGLTLYGDDDDNIAVYPGTIEIADTMLTKTTASGDIAIATAGNWVNGSSGTSQWIYVYVYNNSGVIAYKLSDEAPDLSDEDDNTAELPLRYQKYSTTYYRCIGCVFQDAAGDLCWGHNGSEGLYVSNFDASTMAIFGGLGTGADQTINTIWTPKWVEIIYGDQDTTPAATETFNHYTATQKSLDTNWYATALNAAHDGATHNWIALTTAGVVNAITAQSAGTAGSFTIDAMTDNHLWYAVAYSDMV
jgi:hypothetical protein